VRTACALETNHRQARTQSEAWHDIVKEVAMVGRICSIGVLASAVLLVPAAAQDVQPAASGGTRRLALTVQRGRLSASIENAALLTVLEELSTVTRVTIIPGSGLHDELVSAELRGEPVDDGIRALLKNYDTFLFYGAAGRQPLPSLTAVWVYPRGAGAALRPVPPADWASTKDLEAAVNDRDPSVRERAYDALMSRPDAASHNLVLLAIRGASETDSDVRQRLLSTALSQGIDLPREILSDLVRADGTEEIRLMALETLAADEDARPVIAAALTDPSALVRDRAKEALADLDRMTRRREPSDR
jgi:hypothetical protein